MPSEKALLTVLPQADLLAAVTKLKVAVQDRRRKDSLVAGLLADKARPFAATLQTVSVAGLKLVVETFALDAERGKAGLVAAITDAAPARRVKAAPQTPKASAKKPAAPKASASKGAAKSKPTAEGREPTAFQEAPQEVKPVGARSPKVVAKAKTKAKKPVLTPVVDEATAQAMPAPKPAQEPPSVAPVEATKPAAPTADAAPPTDVAAAPVKKAIRKGPLSWSEAAEMAAHRGQSAASMLQAPMPQTTGTHEHKCTKCKKAVVLQACQVQACNNYYVAAPGRKICSECLFERNTISMDDFNDRLHEERQCTHCGVPMTHLASPGNA
jgi:hypothetical protein